MSMLNIVIHMLFASTGVLSVEWEPENKINLWCRQEKSSNEPLNNFPVNATAASLRRYLHFRRQNRPQFFFHESLEIQMQVGYILSLTKSSVTSCVSDSFCTYGPIFGLGEAATRAPAARSSAESGSC